MNEMSLPAPIPADLRDLPVRFSHLRAYGSCAARGYHQRLNELKPTYAMERGTAVHALLFGNRKVCGYPGKTRQGKAYEEFALAHQDYEILTMNEYDKACRMADAVRRAEYAAPYLQGVTETTLWFDWNGLRCRATPDIRGTDFVTELKCSASSEPGAFRWHARRMNYPAQLWLQHIACEVLGIITIWHAKSHSIVCVEDKAPHPVTLFHVKPRALERGARLLMEWSERLKVSEASAAYPPYSTTGEPLDEPDEDGPDLVFGDEDDEPQQKKSALEYFTAG